MNSASAQDTNQTIDRDSAHADPVASRHPHDRAIPIASVETIDPARFQREFLRPRQPLVITGMTKGWPAMRTWSFEFFRDLRGAEICVESGNVMQRTTSFDRMGFATYIDHIIAGEAQEAYLSLFEIFSVFPQLKRDVDFGLIATRKLVNEVVGWLGPGGTVTGYHIDWADNLFAQIIGRKRFFLVPLQQTECMYPSAKYDWFSRLSHVDPRVFDGKTHPRFDRAQPQTALLGPGEMCFIPRGWWHYVESLDPSISVNNFGLNLTDLAIDGAREVAKAALHRLGIYRRNCTCHMIRDGKRVRKP